MATWQVQQAKSHFSELLDQAETDGPQTITRHGTERAVVLSIHEYRKLAPKPDLVEDAARDTLLHGPKLNDQDYEQAFGFLQKNRALEERRFEFD